MEKDKWRCPLIFFYKMSKKLHKNHRAKKKKLTVSLRGQEVELIYGTVPKDSDGTYSTEDKKIIVSKNVKGERALEVELHESLHACLPDASEEAITETAESIGSMLWELGYRKSIR